MYGIKCLCFCYDTVNWCMIVRVFWFSIPCKFILSSYISFLSSYQPFHACTNWYEERKEIYTKQLYFFSFFIPVGAGMERLVTHACTIIYPVDQNHWNISITLCAIVVPNINFCVAVHAHTILRILYHNNNYYNIMRISLATLFHSYDRVPNGCSYKVFIGLIIIYVIKFDCIYAGTTLSRYSHCILWCYNLPAFSSLTSIGPMTTPSSTS